ncbi:MAG: endonuclease/exonuclease/phosphatase family protein [Phycisphaeraceae bacterium]|nr:endonuclease/exonuclease/phosphatase family protein [Phycisphaeraceae bacterium]
MSCTRRRAASFWGACLLAAIVTSPTAAQLRVVSYNTKGEPSTTSELNNYWQPILQQIGSESVNGIAKRIDVLALQEVDQSDPQAQDLANKLNQIYGISSYQTVVAGSGDGFNTQAFVYDSSTVQLLQTQTVYLAGVRPALRCRFQPVNYSSPNAAVYIYNVHLKAYPDSTAKRADETAAMRSNADNLPASTNIIYLGDFNVTEGASEQAYLNMPAPGNGQAFDPRNGQFIQDNPGNNALKNFATYSSTSLYSRIDLQLPSTELGDGEGLDLITANYHTFGVVPGSGGSAPTISPGILADASDHLPLVADYQLPAKMQVNMGAYPSQVIVDALAGVNVTVSNAAAVVAANGADELDYTVTGSGGVLGSNSGTDNALGGGNSHQLFLDTSMIGGRSGQLSVNSTSHAVENGSFSSNINYDVLAHANAAFDLADSNTLTVDFGSRMLGASSAQQNVSIYNLVGGSMTAALDFDQMFASGDTSVLSLGEDYFSNLAPAPGSSALLAVSFYPLSVGSFSANYVLSFSDQDLPGEITGQLLLLQLIGRVLQPGDANGDDIVNLSDLQILGDNWQQSGIGVAGGDFNDDGITNLSDLQILGDNWGAGVAADLSFQDALNRLGIDVPEPTTALSLLLLLGYRGFPQRRR